MKPFNLSIILFFFLFISKEVFSCTFSEHSKDISAANISGAKVYMLIDRTIGDDLMKSESFSFIQKSIPEDPNLSVRAAIISENTTEILNQILKDREPLLQSQKSDVKEITNLVKSGKVRWIGIEYSPDEYKSLVNHYLGFKEKLNILIRFEFSG